MLLSLSPVSGLSVMEGGGPTSWGQPQATLMPEEEEDSITGIFVYGSDKHD